MIEVEEKTRFLGGVKIKLTDIEDSLTSCYTFYKIPQEQLEPLYFRDLKVVVSIEGASISHMDNELVLVKNGDFYGYSVGAIRSALVFFMEENGYFWKIKKFYKWLEDNKDGTKLLVIEVKEDNDGDEKGEVGYIVVCPTTYLEEKK